MTFDDAAPILEAAGLAQATNSTLDVEQLAAERDKTPEDVLAQIQQLEAYGLMLSGLEEGLPPILLVAGRQYLRDRGTADRDVLEFLPHTIDNLNTRRAVLDAGSILVDEFSHELAHGWATDYARELVPPAFAESVTDRLAVDLCAAAVALLARLSAGLPAGCLAEEIVAVSLLTEASAWLEMQAESGALSAEDARAATEELRSVFELFQDDDVLNMFQMKEPADAAVWGESPVARQLDIADQRLAAWFEPFFGLPATGHLARAEDRPGGTSHLPNRLLTLVSPAEVTVEQPGNPDRFRVCIRIWDDSFDDRAPYDRMPDSWIYHITAATAEQARLRAFHMFPSGPTLSPALEDTDAVSVDRQDIARLAVDVQRIGLPQRVKPDSQYHIVGRVELEDEEQLRLLAGHLTAAFPVAVVATDSTGAFFAVTVNAESVEEAEADLDDQLTSLADRDVLGEVLVLGSSCGIGGRDVEELMREIERYTEIADNHSDMGN